MTVVRREMRRRWFLVLASAGALAAVPAAIAAWPTDAPRLDPQVLRDLVRRSGRQPYEGYAESIGVLGLPELPRLGRVTSLLSGNTRMRAWYAAGDRWRVDAVDTGSERGTYRTPDGVYAWDYGANQLTQLELATTGVVIVDSGDGVFESRSQILGETPARLPRAADLMPPDLARRLLAMAEGDRVESVAGRRVAGVAAAGLRITSADAHCTVGSIDIWADPRTGLPLQVEVTARNAERPILVTRFLDVARTTPAAGVLTPPAVRESLSVTTGNTDDAVDFLLNEDGEATLPRSLGGLARHETFATNDAAPGEPMVVRFRPFPTYGRGLTQFVVLPLSRRVAGDVYRGTAAWGVPLTFPTGRAALVASPLLSVMAVQVGSRPRTYLLAGMVNGDYMQRIGAELAGGLR